MSVKSKKKLVLSISLCALIAAGFFGVFLTKKTTEITPSIVQQSWTTTGDTPELSQTGTSEIFSNSGETETSTGNIDATGSQAPKPVIPVIGKKKPLPEKKEPLPDDQAAKEKAAVDAAMKEFDAILGGIE